MHGASSELETVLNPVIDELSGGAGGDGSLGNGLGNLVEKTRVEGSGDDVFWTERESLTLVSASYLIRYWLTCKLRESLSGGHLHALIDLSSASIKGSSEQEREAHYVVNLVRVVRSASSNDGVRSDGLGIRGADLGLRVSHSEDNGGGRH